MTERLPPEQAKLDGERMFHLLMENVKDFAIFLIDPEGRIVSWNAGAERILGFKEEEILGQPFSLIFTPEDIQKQRPEFELRKAAETGRVEDERWHLRKNGSRFWASGVVTQLRNENGQMVGFAKILRDITERKRAEEQLAEANQRKDEFLAMLAHELRNPLAPILNVLPIFKREAVDKLHLQDATGMVERSLGRVVRIIDDLRDVSGINNGKVQLRKERLSLQTAVHHAVESARSLIEARSHKLTVSMPPEAIWLDADPVRIEQVFVNLLNNAAKYTEPGGQIDLTVERLGNDCVVRLKDTGIGILSEMLPRIFELFVQADKSLDRSQGGLGIGLSLAKRLVEMHGGTLEAHSEGVGHGSEFVVRLLAVPETAGLKPQEAPDPKEATQGASRRILVVDDSVDTAESLAMILRLLGHEVTVAHTGAKALEAAQATRPDVVLLDIGLPGMDGFQVAERMRQNPNLAKTRLIAISGYGQESDHQRSKLAGFDQHLVKPVDPASLQDLLK